MDQDTLIAADITSRQLVKYTIDSVARTCTGQVLDTGYWIRSVSCSQGGLVYATEGLGGVLVEKVRVYNIKTGHREVWDPSINSESSWVHVSLNAGFIVISAGNHSYLYNKDRVLQYTVIHEQVSDIFWQTYVTDTGVFWGTTFRHKLLIMNLHTKHSTIITEGIVLARGVSGTRNGFVYVTEDNSDDVGVYSTEGTFLHKLFIGSTIGERNLAYSGAISLSNTEDLIAFSTWDDATPIAVYRSY